jgi:hypothetical protein
MNKGSIGVINLKKFVGASEEFGPNYQFERPFEFATLVKHYMIHYYDAEREPERYLQKLSHAVRWANKSILLDKLGIPSYEDVEEQQPELFKSAMLEAASGSENISVEDGRITFVPSFEKSLNGNKSELNRTCEAVWKKAFDTVVDKSRT